MTQINDGQNVKKRLLDYWRHQTEVYHGYHVPVKASSGRTSRSKPSVSAAASKASTRAMFRSTWPRRGENCRVAMCILGVGDWEIGGAGHRGRKEA